MRRSLGHVALAAWIAFPGCGDDAPSAPDPPAGPTTAAQVVEAYAQAMDDRDREAYVALLEPTPTTRAATGFRWYPPTTDLDDLPWLSGADSWDLEAEVDMISNMFDSTFVSREIGQSVYRIDAAFVLETQQSVSDVETLASCVGSMTVLWGPMNGLRSDVRLEFLLVRGGDGFLKIRSVRERSLIGARSETLATVEPRSMSRVKALYRS